MNWNGTARNGTYAISGSTLTLRSSSFTSGTYTFQIRDANVIVDNEGDAWTKQTAIISFPDRNFEAAVREAIGKPSGNITIGDVAGVTVLRVNNRSIASLGGIEYFTSLTTLECGNNRLATLDISANTALARLVCNNNQLTSLDVSRNTRLTYIAASNNQLTSLNVRNNTLLERLEVSNNRLTSLDISRNTALTTLFCRGNVFTSKSAITGLDESRTALTV
jgi:Leucine-rich repeat (LRR) protein